MRTDRSGKMLRGPFFNILLLGIIFATILVMAKSAFGEPKIKEPNVSGQFYSADPAQLSKDIDQYFAKANLSPLDKHIDILVAPHAGYFYSGAVAAYSFKAASRNQYKTIVILAPSHFFGFDGISVYDEGGFQTPLGVVEVDAEFTKKLASQNKNFYFEPRAFEREHALEVELPFLQKTFKDFKIVPVIMGQPSFQLLNDFALALHQIIGEREDVLVVVSTDLSHYHDDAFARAMDQRTLSAVQALNAEGVFKENYQRTMEMCGFVPVTAAILYARMRGIRGVELLRYANSGDVTGDKQKVVGYSAMVMYRENQKETSRAAGDLTREQKKKLLDIARATLEEYVKTKKTLEFKEPDPRLSKEEGAFVTIRKQGQLRGCIGNILGGGPLYLMVRNMAIASATQDPRFKPVAKEELGELDVEVSVLSIPHPVNSIDEIQLGTHGVIVKRGDFNQGLFLPQVATETGWSKERFLSELCSQKAGLSPDCWKDPQAKFFVFTAEVFSEKDVQ